MARETYIRHPFDGKFLVRFHFIVVVFVDPEEEILGLTPRLGHLPHDVKRFLFQLWREKGDELVFLVRSQSTLTTESGISERYVGPLGTA